MLFSEAVFVGLEATAGQRPMSYVGLDKNLRLIARDQADMETVLAFIAGQEKAIVAVNAPQSLNKGLMEEAGVRQSYNLDPEGKTWTTWRVCEFELRRRNIRILNSPSLKRLAPGWVENGFEIYRRLGELGFRFFVIDEELHPRTMLEVQTHACFSVLLKHRPFSKSTLEGRMQRQLVLYLEGLDIPNPMHAIEEITQHHLLTSNLPLRDLCQQAELDALAAAYTAYLASTKPERVTQLGLQAEGLLTLPSPDLQDFYS